MKLPPRPLPRVFAVLVLVVSLLAPAVATATRKVMIITNRGCEEICRSFQQNLQSQGDVSFVLRDIGGEVARVPALIAEARTLKTDLIATWGTGVTLAVIGRHDAVDPARHVTDIPVVYLYVGDPVGSKIAVDEKHSGRPNVAGANTAVPIEAQINLMKSYRALTRVGMIFNGDEPAAVTQTAEAKKHFEARGVPATVIELPAGKDGKPHRDAIAPAVERLLSQDVDFLYYVGSSFMLAHAPELFERAARHRIPTFTALEPAYRKGGALLGLISPLNGIGQIGAYQAAQILFRSRAPGSLETPTLSRHSVLINMKTARDIRVYPPMKLLQFAEITSAP